MNMWQSILIPIIDLDNESEIPLNFIVWLNFSIKYTAKLCVCVVHRCNRCNAYIIPACFFQRSFPETAMHISTLK